MDFFFFILYSAGETLNSEKWVCWELLLINLLACHVFSRFPDCLLIIKLYFSYFSNLYNTMKHIHQHKLAGSCLSLKSHLHCWMPGLPGLGSPRSQRYFPAFPPLRLSLDSDSISLISFSSLPPSPPELSLSLTLFLSFFPAICRQARTEPA